MATPSRRAAHFGDSNKSCIRELASPQVGDSLLRSGPFAPVIVFGSRASPGSKRTSPAFPHRRRLYAAFPNRFSKVTGATDPVEFLAKLLFRTPPILAELGRRSGPMAARRFRVDRKLAPTLHLRWHWLGLSW